MNDTEGRKYPTINITSTGGDGGHGNASGDTSSTSQKQSKGLYHTVRVVAVCVTLIAFLVVFYGLAALAKEFAEFLVQQK